MSYFRAILNHPSHHNDFAILFPYTYYTTLNVDMTDGFVWL